MRILISTLIVRSISILFGVFTMKSFLGFLISAIKFLKIFDVWGLVSYKTVSYKKKWVYVNKFRKKSLKKFEGSNPEFLKKFKGSSGHYVSYK